MFLVLISYTQPLAVVDLHVDAHRDYLRRQYAAGTFLLSGRKEPRDGGVIVAKASSYTELEAVLADDPFAVNGVAAYQIVEFKPTMAAPGLEAWIDA